MILTAGLTPAWQQILVFDRFVPGEVNRAKEALWCASGKVLNAGIAAHHLGAPSLTLSPLGGPAFNSIAEEFYRLGTPCQWVRTGAATRVCTTLLDRSTKTTTELVENGRPLDPGELNQFLGAFAAASKCATVLLITGSLPEGTPPTFYRELLARARCPAILDFRGEGLLSALDLEPLLVKPNRHELAATLHRPLDTDDDLLGAMRELNHRGARWVVVTQGPGEVWVTSKEELFRFSPTPISDLVNPIASGDAMAAALAWAVAADRPITDAIRLGIAAAAQNARQLLPCRLDPATVETAAAQVKASPA